MKIDRRSLLRYSAAGLSLSMVSSVVGAQEGNESEGNETTDEMAGNQSNTDQNGDGAPQTHEVLMVTDGSEYYFDPIGLHVQPGDTVRWTIDSGTHSSTAYEDRIPENAEPWDSGTLAEEGASFEYTFEEPGTYDYYCIPHKTLGMIGRIVCGEPGGPAEGSTPPDTPTTAGEFPTSQAITEQGSLPYPFTGGGGGNGENGGEGGGEVSLEEVGIPYQAHFVGIGALFVIFTSIVYSFYFLKYAESPEHTDQRDR